MFECHIDKFYNGKTDETHLCQYQAVYLKVVNDLSEETFMQAFLRFSSRKSLPRLVLFDNASTFVSAMDDLKTLFEFNTGLKWNGGSLPAVSLDMAGMRSASLV